jgi:hypothetical protein
MLTKTNRTTQACEPNENVRNVARFSENKPLLGIMEINTETSSTTTKLRCGSDY